MNSRFKKVIKSKNNVSEAAKYYKMLCKKLIKHYSK
jgi:hypothetical protein